MFHQRMFVARTVSSKQKQVHATNATYERADPLSLFHSFVFICFFGSAVVLDLDLPEGEGRKTALGEAASQLFALI